MNLQASQAENSPTTIQPATPAGSNTMAANGDMILLLKKKIDPPLGNRRHGAADRVSRRAAPVLNSLPNLQTMDGNAGIDFEAEPHASSFDLEHRDFEQALKAPGPVNHYRFLVFPRQDQHGSYLHYS